MLLSGVWAYAVLGLASMHLFPLALERVPLGRAAWCWPSKGPRCVLPWVNGGACFREGAEVSELLPGESCVPSCMQGFLAGSCTELRCPPSGPEPTCLGDLDAGTWWGPCGYGSECLSALELGMPAWAKFGHYSCGPAGPWACESIGKVTVPTGESSLQSLGTTTIISLCSLAILTRFSRLVSECVPHSWLGGSVARTLHAKAVQQWSLANFAGAFCIAAICVWLCLLPLPLQATGIATAVSAIATLSWAFFRAGVHDYVFMAREAAWRIHYGCGMLTIILGSVHGVLNLMKHGFHQVLSIPHWLCGACSLLAMVVAVLPAALLKYDRFKQLHFLSVIGYLLAIAHMVGHALQLRTLASILITASSVLIFLFYAIQRLYLRLSWYEVEIQSADVTSDSGDEHLFLALKVKDFSFGPGQWGRLLADQVSSVPHPFTLVPGEGASNVQLFMKVCGGFTDQLAMACRLSSNLTSLKLQGPYGLPAVPTNGIARTVFVLGGIGVTPALSLASVAAEQAKIALFWSLRSLPLLQRAAPLLDPHMDYAKSCVQVTMPVEASEQLPLLASCSRTDVGSWLAELGEAYAREGISQVLIFVCGPPRLVSTTLAAARRRAGGLAWHVHLEEFRFLPSCMSCRASGPGKDSCPVKPQPIGSQSEVPVEMEPLRVTPTESHQASCAAFCGPRLSSLFG